MKVCAIFVFLFNIFSINCYILEQVDSWSVVKATNGEIWPKPFEQTSSSDFFVVRPDLLDFKIEGETCDTLTEAIKRYKDLIKLTLNSSKISTGNVQTILLADPNFAGFLDEISIDLKNACEEKPHHLMDEAYKLRVTNSSANLQSDSIWGILRGLESFSQLLVVSPDRIALRINDTEIYDKPRFAFRGLLVDTSRHFIKVSTLKQILDGIAYNKLNVFHWHIVDDHSFPYVSKTFPELSSQGAYSPLLVYSQNEIQEIIEYARLRGIRTIAEFDTPGHTRSWGVSHPEILTACEGVYAGTLGPIDPTKNETYTFMQKLLAEVVDVFPDDYVHLGGDEVGFECWRSNQNIRDFMKSRNIASYQQLEEMYVQRIVDMVKDLSHKSIVWQEVFQNGVRLDPETVVHVWLGDRKRLLNRITDAGLSAILSSCWYLDHLANGGDWRKYYECEPSDFTDDEHKKSLLKGGEACMWSEVVDDTNILQRIFPRVSATAEKLWSQARVNDINDAKKRIEEHVCRMRKRGIPAQPPNGPGFCL